jgi:hypothetical protein
MDPSGTPADAVAVNADELTATTAALTIAETVPVRSLPFPFFSHGAVLAARIL